MWTARFSYIHPKRSLAHLAASVASGSEPPNAGAALQFIGCALNPPFVKSGNLLPFSALSVFAGVDILSAAIANIYADGGTEPHSDCQLQIAFAIAA